MSPSPPTPLGSPSDRTRASPSGNAWRIIPSLRSRDASSSKTAWTLLLLPPAFPFPLPIGARTLFTNLALRTGRISQTSADSAGPPAFSRILSRTGQSSPSAASVTSSSPSLWTRRRRDLPNPFAGSRVSSSFLNASVGSCCCPSDGAPSGGTSMGATSTTTRCLNRRAGPRRRDCPAGARGRMTCRPSLSSGVRVRRTRTSGPRMGDPSRGGLKGQ
mmetsp:Transcript_14503/g.31820  ORF Transcript_14503/g.31820 Transcript_14503/m.31820 type:complete len:217 (+) Transcript_14503:2561-3211(+)